MYTNIPHGEGIEACREALEREERDNPTPSATFICKLIEHILTLNYFQFEDNMWLQKHGTAMGTCMAPSYANLFMGPLEEKMLETSPEKPIVWLRYIDDIFFIWSHGRPALETFITHVNNFHHTIKFTSEISPSQIPFLDVMVSLKDGKLQTDLFSKKTDTFNYLHWGSCHPHHTKQSIPYSLAFRLIRICSTEETLTSRLKQLTTHLKRRGYPHKKIAAAINRARNTSRPQALQRRQNKDTQAERIPLVHTYNPALPNISSILLKHLPVLHSSYRCRKAIPEPPMAAFRRPTNLKDMLVHSTTTPPNINPGFSPCNSCRCKTCFNTAETVSFQSSTDGQTYRINQSLSCYSHNVIYLITCNQCNKQYVGQTSQTLRQRFTNHRFDIRNDRDTPVARHFNLPQHSLDDVNIIAINCLPTADNISILNKETHWIHTLKTSEPQGINVKEQSSFPISILHT